MTYRELILDVWMAARGVSRDQALRELAEFERDSPPPVSIDRELTPEEVELRRPSFEKAARLFSSLRSIADDKKGDPRFVAATERRLDTKALGLVEGLEGLAADAIEALTQLIQRQTRYHNVFSAPICVTTAKASVDEEQFEAVVMVTVYPLSQRSKIADQLALVFDRSLADKDSHDDSSGTVQ